MTAERVLISSGGYKFHLAPLAAEMAQIGVLAGFMTAGWPHGWQRRLALQYPNSQSWQRFLDREESIPKEMVHSVAASEVIFKAADVAFGSRSFFWQQRIHQVGYRLYARAAAKLVRKIRPDIYHYRNCYGRESVPAAAELGVVGLCDHSIAHPVCLQWMENNCGSWPEKSSLSSIKADLIPLYQSMEADLSLADHTLVNSDFVKLTCVYAGMDAGNIHVVYWGVDEAFFRFLETVKPSLAVQPGSLLFAGGWQARKGIGTLVEALEGLSDDWRLEIAGGIDPRSENIPGMDAFLARQQVKYLGILPRSELAAVMKRHRIFVFPSFCEGSARVIFEALAAGCYVITTPNSGSIVQDRVHGRLIAPGDISGLRNAIATAIANPDLVKSVGEDNAQLVATKFRQRDYGNKIKKLYERLLA